MENSANLLWRKMNDHQREKAKKILSKVEAFLGSSFIGQDDPLKFFDFNPVEKISLSYVFAELELAGYHAWLIEAQNPENGQRESAIHISVMAPVFF